MTETELRELDAEIHRDVFGLACQRTPPVQGWYEEDGWIPRYSGDIAAAARLWERVGTWSLWFDPIKSMGCVDIDSRPETLTDFDGLAELPAAICRAALAAVRAKEGKSCRGS